MLSKLSRFAYYYSPGGLHLNPFPPWLRLWATPAAKKSSHSFVIVVVIIINDLIRYLIGRGTGSPYFFTRGTRSETRKEEKEITFQYFGSVLVPGVPLHILGQHPWIWCFRSKELKLDDVRSPGTKQRLYHCPHCPYTNTNPKLVHGHKIMHSAPQLKCSYCGHLDHYPSRMMRHMRRRHRGMAAKFTRLDGAPTEGSTSSPLQSTTVDDDADGKRAMLLWLL